jgi:hypothetical protein
MAPWQWSPHDFITSWRSWSCHFSVALLSGYKIQQLWRGQTTLKPLHSSLKVIVLSASLISVMCWVLYTWRIFDIYCSMTEYGLMSEMMNCYLKDKWNKSKGYCTTAEYKSNKHWIATHFLPLNPLPSIIDKGKFVFREIWPTQAHVWWWIGYPESHVL